MRIKIFAAAWALLLFISYFYLKEEKSQDKGPDVSLYFREKHAPFLSQLCTVDEEKNFEERLKRIKPKVILGPLKISPIQNTQDYFKELRKFERDFISQLDRGEDLKASIYRLRAFSERWPLVLQVKHGNSKLAQLGHTIERILVQGPASTKSNLVQDFIYIFKRLKSLGHEWPEEIKSLTELSLGLKKKRDTTQEQADRKWIEEFTWKKYAEIYEHFSQQSEADQALFTLVNTLYFEVGHHDYSNHIEKLSVAKVVRNRVRDPKFSQVAPPFAVKAATSPWLNVLFKNKAFSFLNLNKLSSFTFICHNPLVSLEDLQDLYRVAQEVISSDDHTFKAKHYYSRHAVRGRKEMEKDWHDLVPVHDPLGPEIEMTEWHRSSITEKRYLKVSDTKAGELIYLAGNYYILNQKKDRLHVYRNPEYFMYFNDKTD